MKKVIRNGHVAVIHSCDWGAGWYSWHGIEELLFLPELVDNLEKPWSNYCNYSPIPVVDKILSRHNLQPNPIPDLGITWVPVGSRFYIAEYDGLETVIKEDEMKWLVA